MKNLLLLLVLLTLSVSNVSAQSRNSAYERYINQYKGIAVEQMRKYGVPASITLAQAISFEYSGQSTPYTKKIKEIFDRYYKEAFENDTSK